MRASASSNNSDSEKRAREEEEALLRHSDSESEWFGDHGRKRKNQMKNQKKRIAFTEQMQMGGLDSEDEGQVMQ